MTLDDSIQGFRLRVLREAQWRGNVSATCRRYDVSRTVFYRWRARLVRYGPDGLHPKRRTARPGRAPALSVADERRVIAEALAWPTRGPQWVSDRLAQQSLIVAPVTVWRALRRVGLNHRLARLAVLEDHSATTGLLTERTARRHRGRHVAAAQPGDLCSLDSFYIGKLKGVGKVWQLTGCDCASSFGWARIVVGEVTAAKMAAFLTEVVRPGYRAAGWRLKRVLTDNGKEFKASFVTTCATHQVRHTRTKPRHAWTNGFVERLQGTILHEHWRVEFRRHYYSVGAGPATVAGPVSHLLQYATAASWLPLAWPDARDGVSRGHCRLNEHAGLSRWGRRAQWTRGWNCQHHSGTGHPSCGILL